MFRSFLSWRYLVQRRTNLIGIVGIFVAVAALILILSIMTGFLEESRRTVRGSLSDVIIQPEQSGGLTPSPGGILAAVRADERVAGASAQLVWAGIINQRGRDYGRLLSSPVHGRLLVVQLVGVDVQTPLRFGWPALRCATGAVGGIAPRLRIQDEFDSTDFLSSLVVRGDGSFRRRGHVVDNPLFPFLPPRGYVPVGRPEAAIVVGQQLFATLGLKAGDVLQLATAVQDPETGDIQPNNRDFVVAGTSRTGENEADLGRIYMARTELADFLGRSLEYSQVLVRLDDYEEEGAAVCSDLSLELLEANLIAGASYEVQTWEQFRGNLIGAIENERSLMGIMLSLVLMVAGFTIFAILSMMVTEKRRDIGVLCALGATPKGILQLFLMIAFWDALIGSVLGAFVGTWAAIEIDAIEQWLSRTMGVQIFNRDVYLFDHIPSIVQPVWVGAIVLGAFTCALLFAAIPAWRASRLDPLDALRYE